MDPMFCKCVKNVTEHISGGRFLDPVLGPFSVVNLHARNLKFRALEKAIFLNSGKHI